jgi:hypothetical protein
MILGATGNFGGYVARMLAGDPVITLILASRSQDRARAAAGAVDAANACEARAVDIRADPAPALAAARPDVVIHTVGPFQDQDYRVAQAAVRAGAHYLDLADARDFVAGIGRVDAMATQAGVAVIAGASSVPCLSAAFIDHYLPHFGQLSSVDYGISAAQATNRGLGTASAILSYVGKPFTRLEAGRAASVFGWQGLIAVRYPELGLRLFGDCDIPDLALFPGRYPGLQRLRFVAGHEVKLLHLGTWLLSWVVRSRLIASLEAHAERLLRASFLFDRLGSDRSGFHIWLDGTGHDGAPLSIKGFMVARQGHGPHIPCLPAVLLAKRIAAGSSPGAGARPCLDLISLDDYLEALAGLDVTTTVRGGSIDDRWPRNAA